MRVVEQEFRDIGRRIRLLRLSRGVTQGELAERLGIAQTVVSSVELGKSRTTLKRLFQIRDILGCKITDFFEDKVEEEKISFEEIVEAMRLVKQMKSAKTKEHQEDGR